MSALARSLGDYQANMAQQHIDMKAVGAHRPLSRRRSNPPGSPDSDDSGSSSLFGGATDCLTTALSSLLTNHPSAMLMMQLRGGGGHRKLDRSQSEPVTAATANSSRYKTELCRPFEENGTCKYGDKCQFAHGFHELRSLIRHPKYKTELCRTFHTIGFCPYGPRCHFVHNADEARNESAAPPKMHQRGGGKFSGSTADSPSPPSSLSESPTSMNTFFSDNDLFSPSSASQQQNTNTAFLFGASDYVSPLFSKQRKYEDSPSPVGSLASDLDSLSLSATPPPPQSQSPMERALRLPIFSRISETLDED